jgi:hypothetical protein
MVTELLLFQRRGADEPGTPKAAHENGTPDASVAVVATDSPAKESEPEWPQNSWQQAETQEDVIKILASRCVSFLVARFRGSWGKNWPAGIDVEDGAVRLQLRTARELLCVCQISQNRVTV